MSDLATRFGVFVGVVALIVVGAVVVGFVAADTPAEPVDATVDNDYYTASDLVRETTLQPRSGEIELRPGPSRTVLIATDRPRRDVEPIVTALVRNGHEVRFFEAGSGGTPLVGVSIVGGIAPQPAPTADSAELATELESVDGFLVVGDPQFESSDVDAVEEFVDAGGRLLVATDSQASTPFGFGAGDGADSLLDRFGIAVGNGYLYNMAENDANYQRVYADFDGGDHQVVVDGATPVWSGDGTPLATTTEATRYSTTREADSFDVAVRSGNVVVVGDTDVVRSTNYNRADNEQLLGQVLTVLTSGPPEPYSGPEAESPEVPLPPGAEPPTEIVREEAVETGS